jgi:hypothetical protein
MNRLIFILSSLLILIVIPFAILAQEMDVENLQIGIETAGKLIADIPITHFEDADTWSTNMPLDQGITLSMKRRGRPLEVNEIDPFDGTDNEYVLGVKVAFTHRGYARLKMAPSKPIKVPGITKALTMWVCGRSFQHRLYAHLLDYQGNEMILDMGLLDFVGWKKLSIPVPTNIKQHNYHDSDWRGISFVGMSIMTDPEESWGVYYVYFDELRAISDIYTEEHRDEDDMEDGW